MGPRPPERDAEARSGSRHVLVLAYHFPPIGGSGVQRTAKFVRYLPDRGYRTTVLTGSGRTTGFWTPSDETLLRELPESTDVQRVIGSEPPKERRWRNRLDRLLARPEPLAGWWNARVLEHGPSLGRDVDLIYASLTPYETATAAARLAHRLGRPWVADLQDPWALDEIWFYPTGLHRRLDLRRMRSALSTAAAVIVNSNEAEKRFRQELPELADRLVVIPNGFDDDDFLEPVRARDDGRFRIVHAGYLYTAAGLRHRRTGPMRRALGGAPRRVDLLPRSLIFLLDALDRVVAEEPGLAHSIELHLAGVLSSADLDVARRSRLVHRHGYLPHAETVALVRSADMLFLPLHDVPPGRRVGIVPGKTYEYLASGRPILAAVPDGDARDLLARSGVATMCRPRDVDGMAACVAAYVDRWRRREPPPRIRRDVIAPYERRRLTAALAAVFDRVLARESPAHDREPMASSADPT